MNIPKWLIGYHDLLMAFWGRTLQCWRVGEGTQDFTQAKRVHRTHWLASVCMCACVAFFFFVMANSHIQGQRR